MKIGRFAGSALILIAASTNLVQADSKVPPTVKYPPLVTDVQALHSARPKPTRSEISPSVAGASSGAGGFPASPSAGRALSGSSVTTIGVMAIIGGLLYMIAPDGSTGNSSTSSTN